MITIDYDPFLKLYKVKDSFGLVLKGFKSKRKARNYLNSLKNK